MESSSSDPCGAAAGLQAGSAPLVLHTCRMLRALRMSPLERVTTAFIPSSVTSTLQNKAWGCQREVEPQQTKPTAPP